MELFILRLKGFDAELKLLFILIEMKVLVKGRLAWLIVSLCNQDGWRMNILFRNLFLIEEFKYLS